MVQNILFTFAAYTYAKLKRLSLNFFQIYTVQLRKLSTFLTCISVLKPVNPCSCFGRAINDFGKLFSARPYKVTLETKIFRFAPKINFNCELLWFFTPLPLTLHQSTSLAAVLNFDQILWRQIGDKIETYISRGRIRRFVVILSSYSSFCRNLVVVFLISL